MFAIGSTKALEFTVTGNAGDVIQTSPALPTDGSALFAVLTVAPAVGKFGTDRQHAVLVYRGGSDFDTITDYTPFGEGPEPSDLPAGWFQI